MDVKFVKFQTFALDPKLGLKDYSAINLLSGIRIKQILKDKNIEKNIKSGRTPSRFNEEYWNGSHDFLKMQDVDTDVYRFNKETDTKITDFAIKEEKTLYQAPKNSLIVSNAMTIGLAFTVDKPVYLNQNVFHIDVDNTLYNTIFLKWYFNLKLRKAFLKTFASKYYSKDEYGRLLIPNISITIQNKIGRQIELKEQEIKKLKSTKKEVLVIISEIIAEELDFDLDKFEKLKSKKIFSSSLIEYSNNVDCRNSFKFHNEAGKYVYDFLISKTDKKIKDFISEPIVLGKSVSPTDYDEDGEYFYIAMSNIKTWAFEEEGCKKVKEEYWSKNLNKTVRKNDIILARSGEGTIGKVALIEDEEINAIFADFTQRIRLINYHHRLAYYYFRSDLFQYLVYTHKKGLGNNTNIFPSQIQEFPIPNWTVKKQTEIVEKIKTKIDTQKEIDQKIEEKQNEISELIENAILKT